MVELLIVEIRIGLESFGGGGGAGGQSFGFKGWNGVVDSGEFPSFQKLRIILLTPDFCIGSLGATWPANSPWLATASGLNDIVICVI